MSALNKDLVFLVLQFLDEQKFKETFHKLEQESGFFFNVRHFEDMVTNGEWEELEKYLTGFTKVDDNEYSTKLFFEIRKQKYLEALDKRDRAKAVDILLKDLKYFAALNEELFKEITRLLYGDHEQLSKYGDTKSARGNLLAEMKKLIEANPLLRDKLQFPTLENSRLQTLIKQSFMWQHRLCKNPKPNPEINTLFVDHSCGQPSGARAPSPVTNPLMEAVPKPAGFPPLAAHGLFQPTPAALPTSLASWMASPLPHPSGSAGPMSLNTANDTAMVRRPPTLPQYDPTMDYQTTYSEHVPKRSRLHELTEEVIDRLVNIRPVPYGNQSHGQSSYSSDDLPKIVITTLNQGSAVKIGTSMGDAMIWEVRSCERVAFRSFKVWKLGACSVALQASLANDYTASINRVTWSPSGYFCGVAYSKHIVQLYAYNGGDDLRNHLEIEAHIGNVNDLAFAYPNKQLCMVTCGEDKVIKIWDAYTGSKQFCFEGHEAPVYSICLHRRESSQFIFSTATDGKIKVWLYDNMGSRVDYDAPGHSSTTILYSADGIRMFSCGTNKEGESYLVEWHESTGAIKRTYNGLAKRSVGVVQFDTAKNRLLAAGDDFMVKFWDMDNLNLLMSTDADGGLPCCPCIEFYNDGMFLAVSTNDNGIKILANADGIKLLRTVENRAFDVSKATSATIVKPPTLGTYGSVNVNVGTSIVDGTPPLSTLVGMNSDSRSLVVGKRRITEESVEKTRKPTEINEPSQCRSLRLPDNLPAQRATTNVVPQLWRPPRGILMTNDISDTNSKDIVSCFVLSNNGFYVMSASGSQISVFNMLTFKTIGTFMPPPPAATSLAFDPQDTNILAIGMDDSSIQIYNVLIDQVKTKLEGHQKRVTGLAFSYFINVLVSSGADSQWLPPEASGPITHATYSCDSFSVCVGFENGCVCLLTSSTLRLRCQLNPAAYLPSNPRQVYPVVIVAHPSEGNQFAVGLSDGGVHVIEPLESDGKCGASPRPQR